MGDIQKIGDEYYIEFYARGLKYQQKAGPDRAAAEKLLQEIEAKIARGEMGIMVRDADVDLFFKDFLDYAQAQYSRQTWQRYQKAIEHFANFIKHKSPPLKKLSGFTPHVFEQYKIFLLREARYRNENIPPKVINLTLILWREICEYARRIGYLNDNPLLHIKFVLVATRTLNYLTNDELNLLLTKAKPELSQLLEMLVLTGLTVGELVQLRWSHVDWVNQVLKLDSAWARPRTIPLNLRLVELLKWLAKNKKSSSYIFCDSHGDKLEIKGLTTQLKDLVWELRFKKEIKFYTFRHTFAQRFLGRNFSLSALANLLGLTDMARAMIYFCFLIEKKDDTLSSSTYSI